MLPVLFNFGPVTIYTIGLFFVLAFFLVGYLFWRKGKEEHLPEDELYDSFLLTLLWGGLWSRIGFIVLHFSYFQFDARKWIDIFNYPGMLPLLGLAMSAWFLYQHAQKQKWDASEVLDFAVLAIAGGMTLIWLGLFFDGSGFGNVTHMPWGMIFPGVFDKRHPTQLYGAIFYFLLFLYLAWVEPRYRTFEWYRNKKNSAQTGFLFAAFCIAYGVFGILMSLVSPGQIVFFNIVFDVPIRMVILFYGLTRIWIQSGHGFLQMRKREKVVPLNDTPTVSA